ncbi:MAG: PQQ-like beta-propeller repeat protein [Verrucomicrobia bacterium]|nr:PQQ-like beta-propeller repeat protein [Verrucomicrobiota bacterium]
MSSLLRFLLPGVLFGIIAGSAPAAPASAGQNWPQWRGPLTNGLSPDGNPPVTWSETSNVKWKVKLPGKGSATPIVWGDQIFIQTAIATGQKAAATAEPPAAPPPRPKGERAGGGPEGPGGKGGPGGRRGGGMGTATPTEPYQFVLLSLDRKTGKTQWQKTLQDVVPHEGHHATEGTFASASPMTDGKSVFAFFGSRGLHCLDLQGNVKWQKDFGRMRTKLTFGEGSSPVLFDDKIVLNWDHEGEDFVVALDKTTGKELWRQSREEETSWGTPLVVTQDGTTQVITTATRKIRSYDLATGRLLWECAGMTANSIPSPVAADGLVFATSGFRGSALLAIKLDRSGDLTGTDAIAWSYKKNTPYVPSPLLYEGRLYFFALNNATLTSCDAKTGRLLIDAHRFPEMQGVYASPVGASDRVYLVGRNGAATVIKLSDTLEVLATNRLDEKFDASPAIAGREMFLRGVEHLYCLAE